MENVSRGCEFDPQWVWTCWKKVGSVLPALKKRSVFQEDLSSLWNQPTWLHFWDLVAPGSSFLLERATLHEKRSGSSSCGSFSAADNRSFGDANIPGTVPSMSEC